MAFLLTVIALYSGFMNVGYRDYAHPNDSIIDEILILCQYDIQLFAVRIPQKTRFKSIRLQCTFLEEKKSKSVVGASEDRIVTPLLTFPPNSSKAGATDTRPSGTSLLWAFLALL